MNSNSPLCIPGTMSADACRPLTAPVSIGDNTVKGKNCVHDVAPQFLRLSSVKVTHSITLHT